MSNNQNIKYLMFGKAEELKEIGEYENTIFIVFGDNGAEGNDLGAMIGGTPGTLTAAQIREAVLNVARYDIDGLREALLTGDLARLQRTLDGLMQGGEAPPLVLWAMSEEIRALTTIRLGMDAGKPVDMLLKDAKVWGPRAVPVKKALQRLSTAALEAALQHAGQIDRLAKGIGQGNIWEEFLRLGLRLSAKNNYTGAFLAT